MSRKSLLWIGATVGTLVALAGAAPPPQPRAGDPIQGLTANQRLLFDEGRGYYTRPLTQAQGLGPAFNQNSCAACHETPIGGWGSTSVTHFARLVNGVFDPLTSLGGPVLQRQAVSSSCMEHLPPSSIANHIRSRVTPSSLAFGLVEAIPDSAIIALEDPNDSNGDGISGRANRVHTLEDPTGAVRVGRFGWKAQIATVISFSGDAARTEMGLTNRIVTQETAPNGDDALLAQCDPIPGIEDQADAHGLTFVDSVTAFQRYLSPPPQSPRGGMAGETVFANIGCAKCHVPSFTTSSGVTLEEALRGKTIRVYSDFLLHDMGSLADGIPDGDALPTEMKTPPLWNLRTRPVMLHDGSAAQAVFSDRVRTAIVSHAGEGLASRNAFLSLSAANQDALIAFLDSLGRNDYDFDGDGELTVSDYLGIVTHASDTDVSPDEAWAVADLNQNRRIDADEVLQLAQILGIPLDCNQNQIPDWQELRDGTAADLDMNGVPDECDLPACTLRALRVTGSGGTIADSPAPALVRTISIPQQGVIQSMRLTLRMKHTWTQDLSITLRRGNDAAVAILNNTCGLFHDVDGSYVFTDSSWSGQNLGTLCSGTLIDRGGSEQEKRFLFAPGTFRPMPTQGFSTIRNKQMGTTWTLSIIDLRANDSGQLIDWSLEFRYADPLPTDCDGDGVADCAQLDADPSLDCDSNGVPDSCELSANDCDRDGKLDRCEVIAGQEADCNGDGVLDRCEPDHDLDGVPDACDGCPNNPSLVAPGPCGCGSTNGDADADGVPDCQDGCPNDPRKTAPGACGCGVPDTDSDGDGVPDCKDGCPNDARKTAPGACGCGTPDTDSDGDGVPDCKDGCPNNPNKTAPGACGCSVPETDSDGDGVPNCIDGCPNDAGKTAPGVCGCGTPDIDSDHDGTPDCLDTSNETAKLVETFDPTVPAASGIFGSAVASDGTSMLVGAPSEAAGSVPSAGAVYAFIRNAGGSWLAPQRLVDPNPQQGSLFGISVAVSGDVAAVGASAGNVGSAIPSGRVYVYRRNSGAWVLESTLSAPSPAAGDKFGASVAIASGRIVVGVQEDHLTGGGSARIFERISNAWTQTATLVSTDLGPADFFGNSVSADGDLVAVAARRADVGGVFDRGSAYVFKRAANGTWTQQAKLEPPSSQSGDVLYGNSVCVRANRVVVGAHKFGMPSQLLRGKAFVFSTNGAAWSLEATLVAPDGAAGDQFGYQVCLDSTGTWAVASCPNDTVGGIVNAGSVRVFKRTGTQWVQDSIISTPDPVDLPGFGFGLAFCGDIVGIGSPASSLPGFQGCGRVFLFDTAPLDCNGDGIPDSDIDGDGIADCSDRDDDNDGVPDLLDGCPGDKNKNAPGQCGCGIPDTDTDGDGVADCVDGCPTNARKTAPGQCGCDIPDTDTDGDGIADCVDSNGYEVGAFTPSSPTTALAFGWNVSVSGATVIGGAPAAVVNGAPSRGSATVMHRDAGGQWTVEATLVAPDGVAADRFGARVGVSGDYAVIAAPQAQGSKGAAYVFRRSASGAWSFVQRLQPTDLVSGDAFGSAVAIGGGLIAVGAPQADSGPAAGRGAVYLFAVGSGSTPSWTQEAKLVAADGAAGDHFGHSTALSGGLLVVGAPFADTAGRSNSGAAYVYRRISAGSWTQRARIQSSNAAVEAQFGRDVATDGATIAANAPAEGGGAAYAFSVSGSADTVSAPFRLVAAGIDAADGFGCAVAVSRNRLLVSSLLDDVADRVDAGSVHMFKRNVSGAWVDDGMVIASDGAAGDQFGWHAAMDGDVVAVGAAGDDVGTVIDAGSVRIVDLSPGDCDDDGIPDLDTDGDGIADCIDKDDDNDGVPDLLDGCPRDPLKTNPGTCGCGVPDSTSDIDGDGVIDCKDNCPTVANADQADCNNNGVGNACEAQVDCNHNGIIDSCDVASGGTSPDYNGNRVPDECEAATLLVPQEFATIQAAVDAAPQGGIIVVGPGTYIGAVNARGKSVKIHALKGAASTVIDGASVGVSLVSFVSSEGPSTVFNGFTVRRGVRGTPVSPGSTFLVGGGIFVKGSSPTIANCVIEQCRGEFGAGIYLIDSAAVLRGCSIVSNTAVEYGGGIDCFRGTVTLDGCQVVDNVAGIAGGGVHVSGGRTSMIDCAVMDNASLGSGGGVSWDSFPYAGPDPSLSMLRTLVDNNFAVTQGGGGYFWALSGTPRTASVSASRFCGSVPDEFFGPVTLSEGTVVCADCNLNGIPDSGDIANNPSLDCNHDGAIDSCQVAAGTVPDRNHNGVPDECEANTRFVPSAYASIGGAIDAAVAGDVVWIAPGTYAETINPRGKAITIHGDGPSVIIDGTTLTDTLLMVKGGEGPGTVIENLVFRNGRVGASLITSPTLRVGGGAYIESASPTIRNCIFEQNRSQYGGGGYFYKFNGLVDSCTFRSNTALEDGGGLQLFDGADDGRAVVKNSLFELNVSGNNGGGLHLVSVGGHALQNCVIRQNQAQVHFGGGISWYRYGPIPTPADPLTVDACDIEDNTAGGSGGGIYVHNPEVGASIHASTVCRNLPNNVVGPYTNAGGNEFCSCFADLNHDGIVNGGDLGIVLGAWGQSTVGDLNGDGVVTGADIGLLLGAWGNCP
jgi:CxxC motif-containing protein (DUF1111 family)/subtilisin-like proprotein convertase family protein